MLQILEMFSDSSACQLPWGMSKDRHPYQTSWPPDVRFSKKKKKTKTTKQQKTFFFYRVHFPDEVTRAPAGMVCLMWHQVRLGSGEGERKIHWGFFSVQCLSCFPRGPRKGSRRVAEVLTSTAVNELWVLLRKWVLGEACAGRHLLWPPPSH